MRAPKDLNRDKMKTGERVPMHMPKFKSCKITVNATTSDERSEFHPALMMQESQERSALRPAVM